MRLKKYQHMAFNKILVYDKNFIYWPRRYGKTHLLNYIVEHLINNDYGRDILYISNEDQNSKYHIHFMIDHLYDNINKINKSSILFKNDNYIEFCSVKKYEFLLHRLKPNLIIFDDISGDYFNSDLNFLSEHLTRFKCKSVFTSSFINESLLDFFDYQNDFYINIGIANFNFINITYKPQHLIDNFVLIFDRIEKLKRLKWKQLADSANELKN